VACAWSMRSIPSQSRRSAGDWLSVLITVLLAAFS
jgi:hypothetical protein